MNNNIRQLIKYICDGNMNLAKQQTRLILNADHTEKDKQFREDMICKLDKKNTVELPYNLQSLLIAEAPENYKEEKFLLRDTERIIAEKTLATYRASDRLIQLGIPYISTLMLYGESGCGKTELARYIAHKADLPFLYVKFSTLMDAYLGSTQKNLAKIFEYIKSTSCVLCFDEIDTIGMARGQENDIGEMNRIVIAIMQELDQLSNNVIIIGTTNRYDRLDKALIRRFSLKYEVTPLSHDEALKLSDKFFGYANIMPSDISEWFASYAFPEKIPAYKVIKACTEYIVAKVLKDENPELLEAE